MKILVIEDNETLANAIFQKLQKQGFSVDFFMDGEEGLYALQIAQYSLLILDLGLPSVDGMEIIKKIRSIQKTIPILVISARDKLDQRILGLDLGADDYLCKPFELDEVIARVQALLRRTKYHLNNKLIYNNLVFDTQTRRILRDEIHVDLSKRELSIFEQLLLNIDMVISKDSIVDSISTFDDDFTPTAVETYISRIRKKLGNSINLKTVRGLGYILSSK